MLEAGEESVYPSGFTGQPVARVCLGKSSSTHSYLHPSFTWDNILIKQQPGDKYLLVVPFSYLFILWKSLADVICLGVSFSPEYFCFLDSMI